MIDQLRRRRVDVGLYFGEELMAPDINALEPTLTRYGYNVKTLSELLNVRALLYRQLPEERAAELKQQILKTGIPL